MSGAKGARWAYHWFVCCVLLRVWRALAGAAHPCTLNIIWPRSVRLHRANFCYALITRRELLVVTHKVPVHRQLRDSKEWEREVIPGVFLSVALFLVFVWSSEISSVQLRLGDIRPPGGRVQGLGLGGFFDVAGRRSRCMYLLWGARHLLIEHDRGPEVLIVCHWSQILEAWVFLWFGFWICFTSKLLHCSLVLR